MPGASWLCMAKTLTLQDVTKNDTEATKCLLQTIGWYFAAGQHLPGTPIAHQECSSHAQQFDDTCSGFWGFNRVLETLVQNHGKSCLQARMDMDFTGRHYLRKIPSDLNFQINVKDIRFAWKNLGWINNLRPQLRRWTPVRDSDGKATPFGSRHLSDSVPRGKKSIHTKCRTCVSLL